MDVDDTEWEVPKITSEDEFELCRPNKEKGKLTGKYERLESRLQLKTTVVNWDTLFVQFRDMEKGEWYTKSFIVTTCHNILFFHPTPFFYTLQLSCEGIFYPVKVSLPSLLEDDEDEVPQAPDPAEEAMSAVRKGKRKARPESPTSEA